jgi:hypothetical protein
MPTRVLASQTTRQAHRAKSKRIPEAAMCADLGLGEWATLLSVPEVLLADVPDVTTNTVQVSRTGRRRPRRLALGLASILAVGSGLAWWADSSEASGPGSAVSGATPSGLLTGSVPLCYGPGPDLNLTPTLVVVATQNGKTKATVTVPATVAAHSYHLSLSPGTYTVRAGAWPTREVKVQVDAVTIADLPGLACL